MPVVGVSVRRLNALLGGERSSQEIYDALDWLGCDVKEIVTVTIHRCPSCGGLADALPQEAPPRRCEFCGGESESPFEAVAKDEQIQIDLLPARPDILDTGGLARALKGFFGAETGLPRYEVARGALAIEVDPALSDARSRRPALAAAVVRVPPVDAEQLREVMRLQENLHWAIGRGRRLCSIGVYDLATVRPPFRYTVLDPDAPGFVPLGCGGGPAWSPRRILDEHPKGRAFAHLLREPAPGLAAYPLLVDAAGRVLSMPPIINSDETRVQVGTADLLIDVTGLSQDLVERCLATLVCSLVEMGARGVESVEVRHPAGAVRTPDLAPRRAPLDAGRARRLLGFGFTDEELVTYLRRMRNDVEGSGPRFEVVYAAYRTDIKHEVDLMEDVAIAHGFANIPMALVPSNTPGRPRDAERVAARARAALLGLGFVELTTFMLANPADLPRMRLPEPPDLVRVSNPKTLAQGSFRHTLLGGLLDTLERNATRAVPQRVFEIGLVARVEPAAETGAAEEQRVAFAAIGPAAGYAEGRSVLDALARELGLPPLGYRAGAHPTLLEGRAAELLGPGGERLGWLGEVHPEVLLGYGLGHPVAIAELRLPAASAPAV